MRPTCMDWGSLYKADTFKKTLCWRIRLHIQSIGESIDNISGRHTSRQAQY
jgi:hypothetical protein